MSHTDKVLALFDQLERLREISQRVQYAAMQLKQRPDADIRKVQSMDDIFSKSVRRLNDTWEDVQRQIAIMDRG